MDLVEIGDCAVSFGDIADGDDRSNIAVHAVDALEGHDLGTVGRDGAQQRIEMGGVVMSEDEALGARPADAFDHRIVVERVREDRAVRHELAQCAERGEVGDPSRCEDKRGILAVEVGEFGFELDMLPVGSGGLAHPLLIRISARAKPVCRQRERLSANRFLSFFDGSFRQLTNQRFRRSPRQR